MESCFKYDHHQRRLFRAPLWFDPPPFIRTRRVRVSCTSPYSPMAKRPQKRRRLSTTSNSTSGTEPPSTSLSPPVDVACPSEDSGNLSCNSCHRSLALQSTRDSSQNNVIMCPRCVLLWLFAIMLWSSELDAGPLPAQSVPGLALRYHRHYPRLLI